MGTLTDLQLKSKLWCTVCWDTFLSQPALGISAVCSSVAITPPGTVDIHDHGMASSLFVHWAMVCTNHCIPGTAQLLPFGDTLTQLSSRHSSSLVKVSQMLTLPIFPASNRPTLRNDCLLPVNTSHSLKAVTVMRSSPVNNFFFLLWLIDICKMHYITLYVPCRVLPYLDALLTGCALTGWLHF